MLMVQGGAVYPYFLDRIIGRPESEGKAMRALILVLSILAIIGSAHVANAGLSSTPRETLEPADTAIATDEATQETEDQIGLTKAKLRKVQRGLTRLGFDTKVNGKFDESTRAATMYSSPLNYPPLVPKDRRLIITGLGDRLAPPEQAELLWEHWDRCAFHWFPGNHILHVSQPDYLRRMTRFMRDYMFN